MELNGTLAKLDKFYSFYFAFTPNCLEIVLKMIGEKIYT